MCNVQLYIPDKIYWHYGMERCAVLVLLVNVPRAYEGGNGLTSNFIFMGKVIILHGMTQFMQIILT